MSNAGAYTACVHDEYSSIAAIKNNYLRNIIVLFVYVL